MCYVKCAEFIGTILMSLSLTCITINILLFFPNWELKYFNEGQLSVYVNCLPGIVGGGLMVFLPSLYFVALDGKDCCGCLGHENCGKRCVMLTTMVPSAVGLMGACYCIIMSVLSILKGPRCLDVSGEWNYPFATVRNYITNHRLWGMCVKPPHITQFHLLMFFLLVGFGVLEVAFLILQVVNGAVGGLCGYFCTTVKKSRRTNHYDLPEFH
ncbi:transmembrane 4 L6 family member 1 isoform X1 [Monodelphis domestica]|nr:transmembrane 4 L6 family member 1 isoform X1 [Monodelphis domestica]XP_056663929.1 transmembrane 4 L6 family member 1 isoform X1 [Monodelphis domestica]